MGKFDFVQAKFPELAEYGNKAESFLNSDLETCGYHLSRVFESSIEIICGLNNVSTKESDGKDREKREIIDELQNAGVIDSNIARTLTSMRRTRNKVAHNDNITPSEIRAFFQDSLSVCNWLMQKDRGSVKTSTRPQASQTVSQPSTHGALTINKILEDYRRNSIVAEEKYEGKRITIKGRIYSVGKYYVLLEDEDDELYADGSVYCYFRQDAKDLLRKLKSGQKFTVTGTWCYWNDDGDHCLKNCQVSSSTAKPQTASKIQRNYSDDVTAKLKNDMSALHRTVSRNTTAKTRTTAKIQPTPPKPQESRMPELEWAEMLRQAELNNQPKTNEKNFSFIKLILRIVWSYPFLVFVLAIGLHLSERGNMDFREEPEHVRFFLHIIGAITIAFIVAGILYFIFSRNEENFEELLFTNGSFLNILFKILLIALSLCAFLSYI